jgi:hypothetical protein
MRQAAAIPLLLDLFDVSLPSGNHPSRCVDLYVQRSKRMGAHIWLVISIAFPNRRNRAARVRRYESRQCPDPTIFNSLSAAAGFD